MTGSAGQFSDEIGGRGCSLRRAVLAPDEITRLAEALGSNSSAGQRGMLADPSVSRLAFSERFLDLVRPHVPGAPRPVRAILFDKSPDVNWLVPWHQDLSLTVRERRDVPGFGPWSVKEGLPHVQPPVAWLESMLTIRLHLDDSGKENGALRVLPGSHRHGKLDGESIARLRESIAEECIDAAAGNVFLMRPLLLHASGRSSSDRRRRVLHIEYCGLDLPDGLDWNPDA